MSIPITLSVQKFDKECFVLQGKSTVNAVWYQTLQFWDGYYKANCQGTLLCGRFKITLLIYIDLCNFFMNLIDLLYFVRVYFKTIFKNPYVKFEWVLSWHVWNKTFIDTVKSSRDLNEELCRKSFYNISLNCCLTFVMLNFYMKTWNYICLLPFPILR